MLNLALCVLVQISGEVLDPAGQPAAGATVKLWRWDGETLPTVMRPWLSLKHHEVASHTTAADGRFRFPAREGRLYSVTAQRTPDELAPLADRVTSGGMLALRLQAAVTLAGTVVRTVGGKRVPVEGAEITATLDAGFNWDRADAGWPMPFTVKRTTTSVKDGSFSLRIPAPEAAPELDFLATFTAGEDQLRCDASLRPTAAPIELELKLLPMTRAASAQLVDASSGKPVAGARCLIFRGNELVSDAEGLVRGTPWVGMPVIPKAHRRVAIDLPEGRTEVVKLEPGLSVKGKLARRDGSKVANARTVWMSSLTMRGGGSGFGWPWFDQTDGDGRFEVGCLAQGWELVGFVEVDGVFVPFAHRVLAGALDLGTVPISTEGRLPGRVLGPDGGPVAGATVFAERQPEPVKGEAVPVHTAPSRAGITDKKGAFLLADLAPGTYRIAAWSPDFAPRLVTHVVIAATPPVTLELPAGATITGTVLDPDGAPAAGAEVQASALRCPEDLRPFYAGTSTTAGKDGRFVLKGLPAGCTFDVSATGRAGGPWLWAPSTEHPGGATDVELRLQKQR